MYWARTWQAIACGMVALSVLSSAVLPRTANAQMPIKIGFYPGAIFMTPIFVADAKGFYKEEGLNATLISVASGPLVISQLGSGAIDIGVTAPSNLAFARQQGLKLVYLMGNATMIWKLVVRNDVKVPNKGSYPAVIRDLKGMNWGVQGRASDGEVFMRVMAAEAGLDPDKDVTWIGVGGPVTGLPALKTGQIHVYMTFDPAPQIAAADGYGQTILDLSRGQGPEDFRGMVYQGFEATTQWAQTHPKEIVALTRAQEKALCWLRNPKNFDELLTILQTRIPLGGLSRDQFREMVKDSVPTFTVAFPEKSFAVWNKLLLKSGLVKAPLSPQEILWKTLPAADPKC